MLDSMSDKKSQNLFWGLFVGGAVLFVLILAIIDPAADQNTSSTGSEPAAIEITVEADDWTLGNPDASVTLVEYADFQCPACAAYHDVIKDVVAEYGDRIQFVYRHFPLVSIHPNAIPAAQAAEAAGRQGKFWEMQDLLYTRQSDWSQENNARSMFEAYAAELGLDAAQFAADYSSDAVRDKVQADLREANSFRLSGTPSFILDNRIVQNAPATADGFGQLIEQRLKFAELLGGEEDATDAATE